jgi:hypothetical protein
VLKRKAAFVALGSGEVDARPTAQISPREFRDLNAVAREAVDGNIDSQSHRHPGQAPAGFGKAIPAGAVAKHLAHGAVVAGCLQPQDDPSAPAQASRYRSGGAGRSTFDLLVAVGPGGLEGITVWLAGYTVGTGCRADRRRG